MLREASQVLPENKPVADPCRLHRHRGALLIVDDDEATCQQMKRLLAVNPALDVSFQTDGLKALEELTHQEYSIAITDLRMPKLDGMELIQEIQRRRLSVSVIVTTGHGSIDEAVQAIRLGADRFSHQADRSRSFAACHRPGVARTRLARRGRPSPHAA